MKLFESLQKYFVILGYSLHYSRQKYHLNVRNGTVIVLLSLDLLANGAYIFYGVKSFAEYLQTIYSISTLAFALTISSIAIVLMPKVFVLIENLEQTIDKSKYLTRHNHGAARTSKRIIFSI